MPTRTFTPRTAWLIVTLALVCLATTGCGGGDPEDFEPEPCMGCAGPEVARERAPATPPRSNAG